MWWSWRPLRCVCWWCWCVCFWPAGTPAVSRRRCGSSAGQRMTCAAGSWTFRSSPILSGSWTSWPKPWRACGSASRPPLRRRLRPRRSGACSWRTSPTTCARPSRPSRAMWRGSRTALPPRRRSSSTIWTLCTTKPWSWKSSCGTCPTFPSMSWGGCSITLSMWTCCPFCRTWRRNIRTTCSRAA